MLKDYLFTSESVSEGHPDKLCDQVSDQILDAIIKQDKNARVACETLATTNYVCVAGEITADANVDYEDVVRQTIKNIGYTDAKFGIDGQNCEVNIKIDKQSADISQGVSEGEGLHKEMGAGDQGMMFGYACNETPEYMPATISLAHQLLKRLSDVRREQKVDWLRPDSKSQVTAKYIDGKLSSIDGIVLSTQHGPDVSHKQVEELVMEECIKKIIPANLIDQDTKYYINPTGRFVIGGPHGDCGLTGRKIIVDTYGGHGAHGGGAFSGKDPTKVDRSAAYAARYIAKNIVDAGFADKVLVQLAYAIGVAEPVGLFVDTYQTGKVSEAKIVTAIKEIFPIKPADIINKLNLQAPIYGATASYGHFGRSEFPWEATNLSSKLKTMLN